MRAFFVFCGLSLCLQQSVAIGQVTANALHNRYPAPLKEEIEVRLGISLTVRYGAGLIACEVRIHPTGTSLLQKEPETLMNPQTVTEIIQEIAPESERGKAGESMVIASGLSWQTIHEYEFVDITRSTLERLPLQANRESPAMLIFKRPECAALQKAREQPPR